MTKLVCQAMIHAMKKTKIIFFMFQLLMLSMNHVTVKQLTTTSFCTLILTIQIGLWRCFLGCLSFSICISTLYDYLVDIETAIEIETIEGEATVEAKIGMRERGIVTVRESIAAEAKVEVEAGVEVLTITEAVAEIAIGAGVLPMTGNILQRCLFAANLSCIM